MGRVHDRILKQRLSRRRLLATAGTAAAGTALVAACGGGGTPSPDATAAPGASPTAGEEVITKDGILHSSHTQVLPSLSLFGATALIPGLTFGFTVFDHLWYVPLDTQVIELMLATNIENPDGEGLEIIVTIGDSFFHDKPPTNGRPVLARDVKASYDAFAADDLAPGGDWFRNIFDRVDAPDDHTVVIRQQRPYAWVFHTAGAGSPVSSSILPEETLPGSDYDLSQDLIGSGRMVITDSRSEKFILARHPNWRIPGEPFLAGIESSLISEPALRQAAFRAGDIDTVPLANSLEADQMKADLGDQVTISSELSRAYTTLQLNLKLPAFQDLRVRKAIRLAINRRGLIQGIELDAEGGAPSGPVPPIQTAFKIPEEEEYFRFAPEEARTLLEAAGFDFDKEFTLKFHTAGEEQQKLALLLQEQLGEVGIKINIQGEDLLSVWLPRSLQTGDYEMTSYTQLPYDDPSFPLVFFTSHSALGVDEPRGRNNMDFFDDEITAAADAVDAELDGELRTELVKDAIRLIMEKEAPMINLFSAVSFTGRRHWYKGWVTGRGSFGAFNGRNWIDTNIRGA